MGMTNREKFKEIYGFDVDCGLCNPYPCLENDCEWWEQCEGEPGCPCDNWWEMEYKEPIKCAASDEEIAKSFIEDVEAVKDLLPTTKNNIGVDCISRAQTLTEIEMHASRYTIAKERGGMGQVEWSDQLIKVSDAVDIIRNLPSEKPQEPRWIPVSERLPEKNGNYLVTCNSSDGFQSIQFQIVEHYGPDWLHQTKNRKVLAWMPLPDPYKAESEE